MQDHLEAILFGVMRSRGYDDTYVQRYKLVTSFFQQRRPLIILICGVPCTGACLRPYPSSFEPYPESWRARDGARVRRLWLAKACATLSASPTKPHSHPSL